MSELPHFGRGSPELLVRLDPQAGVSLQEQIYRAIRQSVVDGVLTPGSRVPSSRALAVDLGVSRTTTELAYDRLHAEGYLEGRRGSGTFVAVELPDEPAPAPLVSIDSTGTPPAISRRGVALASTPVNALRVRGGPARPFRLGAPALDLFPTKLWARIVARRARTIPAADLDYGHAAGSQSLRDAIAQHVRAARGTRCTADQVLITSGAQRAFEQLCPVLLDPGDQAWLEEPGFPGARSALTAAGAQIVPVRVDEAGLDVDAGAGLAPRARLVFVTPSHQFPLGVQLSLARRLALLRWAGSAGAWIVEDDYDSEFRHGSHPIPCLQGLDPDGRVIYIGTFSKSLCPALRLGFVVVPRHIRSELLHTRRVADHHPPLLEQLALADFITLGHYERHLRRVRVAYRERLAALADAIARYGGGTLRLNPVQAGLHAVADLEGADASRVADEAIARGVETMPLAAYATPGQPVRNALVLGFAAVPPDALVQGVRTLARVIDAVRNESQAQVMPRRRAHG